MKIARIRNYGDLIMKRRNFIGGLAALMCGAVAGCKCLATPKVESDPFVKIYTEKGVTAHYKGYSFIQRDDHIYYTVDYYRTKLGYYGQGWTIPIDFKSNQKTKEQFVKECEKFYKLALNPHVANYELIEFVCDNGKSNLFAVHYLKDNT